MKYILLYLVFVYQYSQLIADTENTEQVTSESGTKTVQKWLKCVYLRSLKTNDYIGISSSTANWPDFLEATENSSNVLTNKWDILNFEDDQHYIMTSQAPIFLEKKHGCEDPSNELRFYFYPNGYEEHYTINITTKNEYTIDVYQMELCDKCLHIGPKKRLELTDKCSNPTTNPLISEYDADDLFYVSRPPPGEICSKIIGFYIKVKGSDLYVGVESSNSGQNLGIGEINQFESMKWDLFNYEDYTVIKLHNNHNYHWQIGDNCESIDWVSLIQTDDVVTPTNMFKFNLEPFTWYFTLSICGRNVTSNSETKKIGNYPPTDTQEAQFYLYDEN